MNEVMAKAYSHFPLNPGYSVWRLVARQWVEFVYYPRRSDLESIFFKHLLNYRVNNIVDNEKGYLSRFPQSLFNLSKLNRSEVQEDVEEFFENNTRPDHVMDILQRFSQCVVDLSLNELSVHSLNHSKMVIEKPYLKIESKLIRQTEGIFRNIHPLKQGRDLFQRFFSLDCLTVSKLFLNRTFSRYFAQVTSIQVEMIEEKLLGDPHSLKYNMEMVKSQARVPLDVTFEELVSDNPFGSENKLKSFKEHLIKHLLDREFSSEEDQVEPVKKSNSYASQNKQPDSEKVNKSFIKKRASKPQIRQPSRISKKEDNQKELAEGFELRNILVIYP